MIRNEPNGPNVYKDVIIDYKGEVSSILYFYNAVTCEPQIKYYHITLIKKKLKYRRMLVKYLFIL